MVLTLWWASIYLLIVGMAGGWFAWVILGKNKAISRDRKPNYAILLPLGIAGSFAAGLVLSLLSGNGLELRASGMIASVFGAIAVTALYLAIQGRKK